MTWADAQDAALVAKLRREDAEFAEFSAAVQGRKTRLEGDERDAYRAGFRAGRVRADDGARAKLTDGFTPRQRVAFAAGYGEGRTLPALAVDAVIPSAADVLNRAR